MAGYSWVFSAPASPITITDGTNTYTYTGTAIPLGGYSYTVTDFNENDEVTIAAAGYNRVTATVGDATIVMTEMPEVENLNPNGTSYAIADAKARQQVADLETNVYNDLQNYVTTDTAQTISGQKTLTRALSINNENIHLRTNFAKGTVPSSDIWRQYTFCDNSGNSGNDHKLGCLVAVSSADGAETTRMLAYKNVAGNTDNTQLYIGYNASGTIITSAPACTNNNCIVTQTARTLAEANDKWGFGNGLKIATKEISPSSAGDTTWNYGITFSTTPVVVCCRRSGASTTTVINGWIRGDIGTSSCKFYVTAASTWELIAIGH